MSWLAFAYLCAQATPTVTSMNPVPGSVQSSPGAISISLSANVNSASVSAATVTLIGRGPDGVFGSGDDIAVTPTSLTVSLNVVTLNLAGQSLVDDVYRVRLSGSLVTPATFSNLYGHWKLDEDAGFSAADSSGNGRNGTLNGPAWTTGVFGSALAFSPGVNKVDIDAGTVTPPWTASMWVRRIDSPGIESCLMDSPAAFFTATSLRLEQFNPVNRTGITDYNVADYAFGYTAPENSWVHLTFVGNSLSSTLLYVNGAPSASLTNGINLFVYKLGGDKASSFSGTMDEVQVYSRALSDSEILAVAGLTNCVRSSTGGMLDGEFSGSFPSGNGTPGGDFVGTFTVNASAPPSGGSGTSPGLTAGGCGLGGEAVVLAALWAARRRSRSRRT